MVFEQEEVEEIGRIARQDSSDIVVRTSKFKGVTYIDIRNWIKTDKYTGWSKKGIAIREQDFPDLMTILKKLEKKFKTIKK